MEERLAGLSTGLRAPGFTGLRETRFRAHGQPSTPHSVPQPLSAGSRAWGVCAMDEAREESGPHGTLGKTGLFRWYSSRVRAWQGS
jgi:hypothetical protein